MTKAELVKRITVRAEGHLTRKRTEELVDAVFQEIRNAVLRDGRFSCPPFGTWTIRERKARPGRNPKTGQPVEILPARSVSFRPTPKVRRAL